MSHLILPNGQPARAPTKKGADFATIHDAINIAHNVAGPLAVTLQQLMEKVARLEDRAGITDETVAGEAEKPTGTPFHAIDECEPLQFNAVTHRSPLVTDGDVE